MIVVAYKNLKHEVTKDRETIINERIETSLNFDALNDLRSHLSEDFEELFQKYGMTFNFEERLISINVSDLINQIDFMYKVDKDEKDYSKIVEEVKQENKGFENEIEYFFSVINSLRKYKGYILFVEKDNKN